VKKNDENRGKITELKFTALSASKSHYCTV